MNLDEDIRIWIVHTHEIHVNHHHYHSQPLLTSALVYCDDYDKKVNKTKLFNQQIFVLLTDNRSI